MWKNGRLVAFLSLLLASWATANPNEAVAADVWVRCAYEARIHSALHYLPGDDSGRCYIPYATKVRYGNRGRYVYRDFAAATDFSCGNEFFGDPLVGVVKLCWYLVKPRLHPLWIKCAYENMICDILSDTDEGKQIPPRNVRYGANGVYVYRTIDLRGSYARSQVRCNNSNFGDPLVGIKKHCEVYR